MHPAHRCADSEVETERIGYLEQLGQTLTGCGWTTTVARPLGGPPFLRVTNPELTQLTDTVFCVLNVDGTWVYRGRWGALLGAADDLTGAVAKVEPVLGAQA